MMYPYITLADETLVTHSHLKEENELKSVNVHFERPKPHGFDSARISLPSYAWIMRDGFTDEEIRDFEAFASNNAHLLFKYAEKGGLGIAKLAV
ncbi:MAG: hypothetical protein FWH20_00190 [Oscillospiraceae bacterium]|nr:hypothetical protein [Oscillospiraceae bacterium]